MANAKQRFFVIKNIYGVLRGVFIIWSLQELLNTITDFKKKVEKDYNEVDCCVVAILSHGSFESVQLVDGVSVTLHDSIIHQFNEQKFSVMKGKPKIVILQTCQDYWGDRPISLAQSQSNPFYLRNMIICYPTCPGSLSLRDVYLGSHFIFVLVHVLMNNAHCMEFQEMLEMVRFWFNIFLHFLDFKIKLIVIVL